MTTVSFLDLEFCPADVAAARAAIVERASRVSEFAYVATPNVDHVVKLHDDPETRAPLYASAWRLFNDSKILAWLAARSGLTLPVASGADLAAALFAEGIDPAETLTIVGGDEALIEALVDQFKLIDVRWHKAPMGLRDNPAAIEKAAAFIAAQRARFVFLCVGAPQQEMIAKATLARGDAVGLGLCFGAALEFLVDRKPRAPQWMRDVGLEWLHRLGSEPGRLWRRYLVDGPKIFLIWRKWDQARRRAGAGAELLADARLDTPPPPA